MMTMSFSLFFSLVGLLCGVVDSLFTSLLQQKKKHKNSLFSPYYIVEQELCLLQRIHTHTHTQRERERERESFDDASTKQKEEESASFCRGGEEKEGEDKE
jgi:hypothetical protein